MVLTKKAVDSDICRDKISMLLTKLELDYKDISIYILAFIHRSIVNERPDFAPEHNERLEFLGDAVLELVITNNLFINFPEKTEGDLTDIRSAIVRGSNLAKIARSLDFNEYLYLGKGENTSGGRDNDYLLANVVESFLGAIYLDQGIVKATDFINKYIYSTLESILENNLTKDFKTLIQEFSQAEFEITPTYKVLSEEGPDHSKNFLVGVYLDNKKVGEGNGTSKKKAQEDAAKFGFDNISKPNFYKEFLNNK